MTKKQKSFLSLIILLILIFGIPYLWRTNRDNDIETHSKYAFAKIVRKTGSLKNGNNWDYTFTFQGKSYDGFWPTHVDYDVNIGEYFLVHFSSSNPKHNIILYKYKLKVSPEVVQDSSWNNPPEQYFKSGLKTEYINQNNGL